MLVSLVPNFLMGLVAGPIAIPAGAFAEQARSTAQCDSREFEGKVVPGIPLVAGIVSGMSRAEAKRIAPRMVSGSQRVELLPGLTLPGRIQFAGWSQPTVHGVEFSGSPAQAPTKELTALLGVPVEIEDRVETYEFPGQTLPATHQPRVTQRSKKLRWCNGPRSSCFI